jgi:hypothetical protein
MWTLYGEKSMRESAKKTEKLKAGIKRYIPEILAVLCCLFVMSCFVSFKEGYHMDELLSFELSNAEFTPWIVPTQPVGRLEKFVVNEIRGENFIETVGNIIDTVKDIAVNRGSSKMLSYKADVYDEPVWISSQEFTDYITAGDEDSFNYLSVYFNVKDDNHPPLHFMLLHTISSIFKNTVSQWMGCLINLAAAAGIMVLLIKLADIYGYAFLYKKTGNEKIEAKYFRIAVVLFYGLSAGAVATVLLIRMYALLTFLCVAYFYIHIKKWQDKSFGRKNGMLILVTVLGFLTQYFFLFYCLILAAVTALQLLGTKRIKELLIYIRSMIIAAAAGLICFPFAIADVFSSSRGVEALDNLTQGISGYGERIVDFFKILADRCGGMGIVLICAAAALFIAAEYIIKTVKKKLKKKEGVDSALVRMLIIPVAGYFLVASRMAPYIVDRYIMPLFPFVTFGMVLVLFVVCGERRKLCRIITVLLIIVQAAGLGEYYGDDSSYLYRGYKTQLELAEEYSEYPCICVYAGVGYYENLVEFTKYDRTLLVTENELETRKETESISGLAQAVVIVKYGVELSDVEKVLEQKYGLFTEEVLFSSDDETSDRIVKVVNR